MCERFQSPDLNASLAQAHLQIGPSASDLLRGCFVTVAVDRERDIAFVSRDHLGAHPLVYIRTGDGVLFAEHEREILELLSSRPDADRVALVEWIERRSISSGRTLYDGIRRVPPAHRLALSTSTVRIERYWEPRYEGTIGGSRAEVAEHLREETFAAVDRAAAGANRVALRLSGGLDSACVAAGLAVRSDRALAISAVFPGFPETDERDLIEATSKLTGLTLNQVSFDGATSILMPALLHIDRWQLPPATPSSFVWAPVMALARDLGVDAMLDGEGGDELFGLPRYLIADMLRSGRLAKAWSLAGAVPGVGRDPGPRVRLRALRVLGLGGLAPAAARRWRGRRAAHQRESLLAIGDLLALADLTSDPSGPKLDGPIWWRKLAMELTAEGDDFGVAAHFRREAVDDKVDRRHPFLFDRALVDAVLANPPQMQFDPIRDRALLRDALKGRIPEAVRQRGTKSYFTPLLVAALAGREGDLIVEALKRPDAPIRSFVCSESLDRQLSPGYAGGQSGSTLRLWDAGMANIWLLFNERSEHLAEIQERVQRLAS